MVSKYGYTLLSIIIKCIPFKYPQMHIAQCVKEPIPILSGVRRTRKGMCMIMQLITMLINYIPSSLFTQSECSSTFFFHCSHPSHSLILLNKYREVVMEWPKSKMQQIYCSLQVIIKINLFFAIEIQDSYGSLKLNLRTSDSFES